MRHRSESVLVVLRGQRTTDLIFLQLISAAWRRILFLSVPHQEQEQMAAPDTTDRGMQSFGYMCFLLAICPPLHSDPEQHSDPPKNNLFHLYGDLCVDPLAAYK